MKIQFYLLTLLALAIGYNGYAQPLSCDAGTDKHICIGKSVILGGHPTATGGSAPYQFQWQPLDSLDLTSPDTPTANPSVTTTYYLTVTDFNGTKAYDTVIVLVDQYMTLLVSADTTCSGDSVTFTALPTGYDLYEFINGSARQQFSSSNKWTTNQLGGGNHVYVQVPGNICFLGRSAIDSVNVKPTPSMLISSNTFGVTCKGSPIVFKASAITYPTDSFYFWANSTLVQSGLADTFLYSNPNYGDTITVSGILDDCPSRHSASIIVTQNLPEVNISHKCPAGSEAGDCWFNALYIASHSNADSIQWHISALDGFPFADTTLKFSDSIVLSFLNCTNKITCILVPTYQSLSVCYTAYNSCGSKTVCDTVTIIAEGINEISSSHISIFPNPASTQLNIRVLDIYPQQVIIYNTNGQKVREQKFAPQIDIGTLTNGIYFIEVKDGNTVARTRFVKM